MFSPIPYGVICLASSGANLLFAATNDQAPTPTTITGWIIQLGLSGVFLFQWWDERKQRIKRENQLFEFMERQSPVLAAAVDTLKEVQESQKSFVVQSNSDWEKLVRELQQTQEALQNDLRERRYGH